MEVLSLVRDGQVEQLEQLLKSVEIREDRPSAESFEASEVRSEIFGKSSWGSGMTCLLWAVEDSSIQMAEVLIKYYPSLLFQGDTEGATPLHYSALNGNTEMFSFLLSKGATCQRDNNGETPLHCAALNGHTEVMKVMLADERLDVNCQNLDGFTALHLAVVNMQEKAVKILLLDPRINIGISNNSGQTAKQIAERKGDTNILQLFVMTDSSSTSDFILYSNLLDDIEDDITNLQKQYTDQQKELQLAYKRLLEVEQDYKSDLEEVKKLGELTKGSKCVLLESLNAELDREKARQITLEKLLKESVECVPLEAKEEELKKFYSLLSSTAKFMTLTGNSFLKTAESITKLSTFVPLSDSEKETVDVQKMEVEVKILEDSTRSRQIPTYPPCAGFLIQ
eukprot:TRINITY_DN3410_c0_g1_i3.p1 TRINITY_DN3410_c0_g1~~TRINITY_DN3410_c0_g1_i3.p1  ORF type:complete len:396 (+),score=85.05 TRINITY_DN3410_c0_g1_i3:162-1349(+)